MPCFSSSQNMHIDTTTTLPMDDSLDLGPKPSTGPKLGGFRCCCLPSKEPQRSSSRHHGSSGKKIPSTTRTTRSTDDDDDEIPQFFIDADGIPQDDDVTGDDGKNDAAFWKKLMSIFWLLLAAQYWTQGATRTRAGAESDGEKSLPPEVNVEDDGLDVSLDGEDEAEEER
jgi:hypothetical protein